MHCSSYQEINYCLLIINLSLTFGYNYDWLIVVLTCHQEFQTRNPTWVIHLSPSFPLSSTSSFLGNGWLVVHRFRRTAPRHLISATRRNKQQWNPWGGMEVVCVPKRGACEKEEIKTASLGLKWMVVSLSFTPRPRLATSSLVYVLIAGGCSASSFPSLSLPGPASQLRRSSMYWLL